MPRIDTVVELDRALQQLLDAHGCMLVNTRHLAYEARGHRDERRYYDLESDCERVEAFFHYLVDNGTAIFLFDGERFEFFVFRCDPHELITHVEATYTIDDVEACRDYVTKLLGKEPDIIADGHIAYAWMDGGTAQ